MTPPLLNSGRIVINDNFSNSFLWFSCFSCSQLLSQSLQFPKHKKSMSWAGISESSTCLPLAKSTVKAHDSSKEVSISADKSTKACLTGDSIVKDIESQKISRAFWGKVKVECSQGAKIKGIHDKANELLACGQLDENTALWNKRFSCWKWRHGCHKVTHVNHWPETEG